MFSSIGWTEMMVIAVVAIIFVGPKDLPAMLRQFGRFSRKIRSVAGDFQKQMDDALRESELDSVRDSLNDVRNLDPRKAIADRLNPLKGEPDDPNGQPDPGAEVADASPSDADTPADTGASLSELPSFDEAAGPPPPEPVKVDVEAALARQAELDEAAAESKPVSRPTKKPAARKPAAKPAARKQAAPKSAAKNATAAKASANKTPAKRTAKRASKAEV